MRRQDGKRVPRYPMLYRDGINVDCPEDWYLVNIRAADYGAILEIAKYVAKGDEIVSAGPGYIVTYLMARRGKRMLQGFGSMYKVILLDDGARFQSFWPKKAPIYFCPVGTVLAFSLNIVPGVGCCARL